MSKVDLSRYGGIRGTKLEVSDLTGEIVVVTISEFGEQKNEGQGRKLSPVLRYEEAPEKLHYLNREQMERLVTRLGDDTAKWIGRRIPIHAEDVDYEGKTFNKVYVMPPMEWDDALKGSAEAEEKEVTQTRSRGGRAARSSGGSR